MEEVLRQIDGILYQDPASGKIKAKLIRYDYDEATIPVLDVSTVKDIRNFSKSTWASTYNQVRLLFTNRANDYAQGTAMAQDFSNINFQNRVRSTELTMVGVMDGTLGAEIATRSLSRYAVPLYRAELHCTRAAAYLRPGDTFKLNWAPYAISGMIMRVQRVNLGTLKDGSVIIECIQDRFAADSLIFAPPEPTGWTPTTAHAKVIAARKVFEAPYFVQPLTGASLGDRYGMIWAGGRAPSGYSLGYDAEASTDGFVDEVLLGLDKESYTGSARLVNDYAATVAKNDRYDDSLTGLTIELLGGEYTLASNLSLAAIKGGAGLFVLNGELMAYTSHTDNGDGSYTLTGIYRGLLDTIPEDHRAGDYLWFINGPDGLLELGLPDTASVSVRLLDKTHSDVLLASEAPVDVIQMDSRAFRPLPPAYLTLRNSRTPRLRSEPPP